MNQSVIITAGGIGKRMNSELPKQYITINGLPVLMHTISVFYNFDEKIQIVISLPREFIQMWEDLCKKHTFTIPHEVVQGGKERYHSIKNALEKVKGDIVMVHDAVRPLVNEKTIRSVIAKALQKGAAVPVLPIKDSLRKGGVEDSVSQDRTRFWAVQTPQAFKLNLLLEAYKTPYSDGFTDDASLVEAIGKPVFLTEGNEENIKITTPFDLKLVEFLLK